MDRKEIKKQVIKFYNKNKDKGKIFTVKHFEKKGEKSSAVYNYLKDEPTANSSSRIPVKAKNKTDHQTGRVVKKTRTLAQKPRVLVPIQTSNFCNKCMCVFILIAIPSNRINTYSFR
jgi:hypothetical protein